MPSYHITPAHKASAFAIIDPVYSVEHMTPENLQIPGTKFWHYGPGELEAFFLQQMRKHSAEAKLKVGYPGFFKTPSQTAEFRRFFKKGEEIRFKASGTVKIMCGETLLSEFPESNDEHILSAPCDAEYAVHIKAQENDLPALGSENSWDFSYGFGGDPSSDVYPQTVSGKPPHRVELPLVPLQVEKCKSHPDIWDAGKEVLAKIEIESDEKPVLFAGESIEEVLNEKTEDFEQSTELLETAPGHYQSKSLLALRYFRFSGKQPKKIQLNALFTPAQYAGAFAGFPRESRIWMNAAYTLRLCMHRFLIDGIKRDRLPWGGDLAVSLLANAYTVADAEIVRASLKVLTLMAPDHGDVNGIADYTLWVLINHDIYQKYFCDKDFLQSQYSRIHCLTESILRRRDHHGFFARNLAWMFIDWVPEKSDSTLQMIFYWALKSAANLAKRVKRYDDAARWNAAAEQVSSIIHELLWDPERGLFKISASTPNLRAFSKHANILAISSGLASAHEASCIVKNLEKNDLPPVGTPYMSAFEAIACGAAGQWTAFQNVLESIWGSMLDLGATSFWEAFNPEEKGPEHLVFYDRPFGRSLCHAWGAGPAFLYPMIQLGIRPVSDGWRRFTVKPMLQVQNASCTVPTPLGQIEVQITHGEITVKAPDGCEQTE